MKTKLEKALKRIDERYRLPNSPPQFVDPDYYNILLADAKLIAEQYEKVICDGQIKKLEYEKAKQVLKKEIQK